MRLGFIFIILGILSQTVTAKPEKSHHKKHHTHHVLVKKIILKKKCPLPKRHHRLVKINKSKPKPVARVHVIKHHPHVPRPIQQTVTLKPAIYPPDQGQVTWVEPVTVVKSPHPPIEHRIITVEEKGPTPLLLKKHMSARHTPSPQNESFLKSLLNRINHLFSLATPSSQILSPISFWDLLNPPPRAIQYLINFPSYQKKHLTLNNIPAYLSQKSLPMYSHYSSRIESAVNLADVKEATRMAVVDNELFLI